MSASGGIHNLLLLLHSSKLMCGLLYYDDAFSAWTQKRCLSICRRADRTLHSCSAGATVKSREVVWVVALSNPKNRIINNYWWEITCNNSIIIQKRSLELHTKKWSEHTFVCSLVLAFLLHSYCENGKLRVPTDSRNWDDRYSAQ